MKSESRHSAVGPLRYVLVVPALNEEDAIGGTLRRALAARQKVLDETPVSEMTIVFVNDGSTDRTQEIVDQPEFDEVVKVRFEKNRCYGAAIKAGWRAADGELLGFIDADGTWDPDFSVTLINHLLDTDADVVLAGRLNPDSEMPLVRRIGNRIFAHLLGAVSQKTVTDCASGFRVLRRGSLGLLSPLPDGLHFTPAMSSICMLDPRLSIEEVPLPYKERIGRSKLSVLRDGVRFLYTILFTACCYSPIKMMTAASAVIALLFAMITAVALLGGGSTGLAVSLGLAGGLVVLLMLWTGVIVHQLNFLLIGPRERTSRAEQILQKILNYKRLMAGGAAASGVGSLLLLAIGLTPNLAAYAGLGTTAFLVLMIAGGAAALMGGILIRTIWAVGEKQKALSSDQYTVVGPEKVSRISVKGPVQDLQRVSEPAVTAQ
jgi:hypothetical protein